MFGVLPPELMTTLLLALIVLNSVWVYELYTIKRTILTAATVIAEDYKLQEIIKEQEDIKEKQQEIRDIQNKDEEDSDGRDK